MLDVLTGKTYRNCDGLSRRDMLRIGVLGAGGVTLADTLRSHSDAVEGGIPTNNRAVICFWLDGGPTHLDTFDPKPDAPSEYRGPMSSITTSIPGVHLSETFPRTAALMHRLNVVRSVHHNNGDHFAAAHWVWTGYKGSTAANRDPMYPSMGAVTSRQHGPNRPGMPSFVAVPRASTIGIRPGYQSGTFLGIAHNPFDAGGDPNSRNYKVPNLHLPGGVDAQRIDQRQGLLQSLDRIRRDADAKGIMDGLDRFNQQAFDMITGEDAKKAFDITGEKENLRDRYGRNTVGQSALLARRLVEAGVAFVTVHSSGWDNHSNIENAMRKNHGPRMDNAIASLVEDLTDRGMYDDVLILVMGEFGRTPRVNGNAGRDHWGNVMSVMLGGGGLKGGQIVGASDDKGTAPISYPVRPAHILHTVYKQLGIDASQSHMNQAGRPIPILGEGEPIADLV